MSPDEMDRIREINPHPKPPDIDLSELATRRAQLSLQDAPRPPARKHPLPRYLVGVAGVCAIATVAGLSFNGESGPRGLPAAAEALAEITADGAVIHTVQLGLSETDPSGGPEVVRRETWRLRDGSRSRTKVVYADGTFQDTALTLEPRRYRTDLYLSKAKRLSRGPWQERKQLPAGAVGLDDLPVDDYAKEVEAGRVVLLGETRVDDVSAYRLAYTQPPAGGKLEWVVAKTAPPRLLSATACARELACIESTYNVYEAVDDTKLVDLPEYAS